MDILNSMKDIISHTNSLGVIDMVKVIGSDTEAKIEAIDVDKSVVVFGTMYQPIDGINTTVGMSQLPVLKGFMDVHANSKISVITEQRNSVDTITGIKFDNGAKTVSTYRFMSETMINEQIKVPPFKGATWNITFKPEKKSIAELNTYQGIFGGSEKRFTVVVEGDTLLFVIGTGPTNGTSVPFAKNLNGTLKTQWSYPLSQVIGILKLDGTATMSFSDMGALKIDIDSGVGQYSYIVPAGKS